MKTIGPWAFSRCFELKSIDIPESVNEIENGAFTGCYSLKNFNVSQNTNFGDRVFGDYPWTSIPALSDDYNVWLYDENASDFLYGTVACLLIGAAAKLPLFRQVFAESAIRCLKIPT